MRKSLEKEQLIPIPQDRRRRRNRLDGQSRSADTILDGMRPQKIGRVLGTGVRVAGRMAGERLAGEPRSQTLQTQSPVSVGISSQTPVSPSRQQRSVHPVRGIRGLFKPFTRVGGIVFLEVAGLFFLIFVLLFGQMAWRMRASYAVGPDHSKFLMAAALTLAFLYLSASSFWRASRR